MCERMSVYVCWTGGVGMGEGCTTSMHSGKESEREKERGGGGD